jgi:hypothetical protein
MSKRLLCLVIFLGLLAACGSGPAETAEADANSASQAPSTDIDQSSASLPPSANVIDPDQLQYMGAFRLPGEWNPPETFAYGGNAMTFNPDGDPDNADAHSGSLFIMGHDRIAYGGVPDGNQVAEVSIPEPVVSRDISALNTAEFIQDFSNVTRGYFTELEEIPKTGMQYLNHPATGPLIHLAWGQHLQPPDIASHAWFSPDLEASSLIGAWYIGIQDLYSVNGYMTDIPQGWADAYTGSKPLATGRMRDGGQGGMGPALFAYQPWNAEGSPAPEGTRLPETTLLLYETVYNTENIEHAMDGYQHPDEWEGAAWLTDASGNGALIFAGTKATGDQYWYGYMHPDGPALVCVDDHVNDFPTCRNADGSVCPASDFQGCCDEEQSNCVSQRGWWSNRFDAEIIFYDPADLARVALGEIEPWQPQPYAVLDIDEYLYLSPPEWDDTMLGWGDQRRYRIGDAAFDRENGFLYILELFTDEAKPLVHVWQLN